MFQAYNSSGYTPYGVIAKQVASSYQAFVKAGQKAARDRLRLYQQAYAGEFDIHLPEKIAYELADLGIRTNMAKPVVDAMCAKLNLNIVSSSNEQIASILASEYTRNMMDETSTALHKEAAVNGDAYMLVWPEYGTDGQPTKHTVIRLLQSEDVDLQYDEKDLLKPLRCTRIWNETKSDDSVIVRRDTIMADFIHREYSGKETDGEWIDFVMDGLPPIVMNPLGTIPVIHFKAECDARNRPFGLSQLEPALPIIADINALVKDSMIAAYYASGRQLVVTGVNSEQFLKKTPEGLDRSAFGAHMWADPNTKEFSIPGDDMTGLLALMQVRIKHLAIVTRTPLQYLEAGVQERMSGVALQELELSLSDKVDEAQTLLGSSYHRVFTLVAQICGYSDADVVVEWTQPFAQDTTKNDQEEFKLGLLTAKAYHLRRGLSEEAAQGLVDDLAEEKDKQVEQLFGKKKKESSSTSEQSKE
jgi:hypothetical protein